MMPTSSLILTALTSAAVLVLGLFLLARPDHSNPPSVQPAVGCGTSCPRPDTDASGRDGTGDDHDDELDDISSCTVDSCGGMKNLKLYNKVKACYGSDFLSREKIKELNRELKGEDSCGREQDGGEVTEDTGSVDNDRCCVTQRQLCKAYGIMTDIYNKTVNVLGFDGKYQVIHVGVCVRPSAACPNKGRCTQMDTYVTLMGLVDGKPTFSLFKVNGYCGCRT